MSVDSNSKMIDKNIGSKDFYKKEEQYKENKTEEKESLSSDESDEDDNFKNERFGWIKGQWNKIKKKLDTQHVINARFNKLMNKDKDIN